jgi:hypothetical protein
VPTRQPPGPANEDETSVAGEREYQAPAIVWEEPYEPVAIGITCARTEGNPGCQSLIFT